jgi:hypothetical protein
VRVEGEGEDGGEGEGEGERVRMGVKVRVRVRVRVRMGVKVRYSLFEALSSKVRDSCVGVIFGFRVFHVDLSAVAPPL